MEFRNLQGWNETEFTLSLEDCLHLHEVSWAFLVVLAGQGIIAEVNGEEVAVGNARLLAESAVGHNPALVTAVEAEWSAQGVRRPSHFPQILNPPKSKYTVHSLHPNGCPINLCDASSVPILPRYTSVATMAGSTVVSGPASSVSAAVEPMHHGICSIELLLSE